MGQSSSAMHMDLPHLFCPGGTGQLSRSLFLRSTRTVYGPEFRPLCVHSTHLLYQMPFIIHTDNPGLFFSTIGERIPPTEPPISPPWGTAELLRTGKTHIVKRRHKQAVETGIRSTDSGGIDAINLREWNVVIFSDHGEVGLRKNPIMDTPCATPSCEFHCITISPARAIPPPPNPLLLLSIYTQLF